MVILLVDKDKISLKEFAINCLEINLRDFGWGGEWFIRSLSKQPNPSHSYYYYEIMWCSGSIPIQLG